MQSGIDERFRVGVGVARRCGKRHSAPPIVRRFRMESAKYHPSFAARSFDERRRAVGILAHNRPPTGKLRAILLVMFLGRSVHGGYYDRGLVNPLIHHGVKAEPHTRTPDVRFRLLQAAFPASRPPAQIPR